MAVTTHTAHAGVSGWGHEDPKVPEKFRGMGYHELNAVLNLYDADGNGAGAAKTFAIAGTGLPFAANDFTLQ